MADRTSARGFGTLGSGRRREDRAATTVLDRQPDGRGWKATHPNPPGGPPCGGEGERLRRRPPETPVRTPETPEEFFVLRTQELPVFWCLWCPPGVSGGRSFPPRGGERSLSDHRQGYARGAVSAEDHETAPKEGDADRTQGTQRSTKSTQRTTGSFLYKELSVCSLFLSVCSVVGPVRCPLPLVPDAWMRE